MSLQTDKGLKWKILLHFSFPYPKVSNQMQVTVVTNVSGQEIPGFEEK